MPYTRSRARVAFEKSSVELRSLSRVAGFKKFAFDYRHKNLIYQSAIFRLCASIEEYLKTFFEDLVFEYKHKSARLSNIPDNLRASSILNEQIHIFKKYLYQKDEVAALKNLQPKSAIFKLCVDGEFFTGQHGMSNIAKTQKYPSTKNLKVIYNRIGINDIMVEIQKIRKADIKFQLESFLGVREAISHQSPPPITITDVYRHFDNIDRIVATIDRVAYRHIAKFSGSRFWPS